MNAESLPNLASNHLLALRVLIFLTDESEGFLLKGGSSGVSALCSSTAWWYAFWAALRAAASFPSSAFCNSSQSLSTFSTAACILGSSSDVVSSVVFLLRRGSTFIFLLFGLGGGKGSSILGSIPGSGTIILFITSSVFVSTNVFIPIALKKLPSK